MGQTVHSGLGRGTDMGDDTVDELVIEARGLLPRWAALTSISGLSAMGMMVGPSAVLGPAEERRRRRKVEALTSSTPEPLA